MSGGHFDYKQYELERIADEIEQIVLTNDSTEKNSFGFDKGNHFSRETITRLCEAVLTLKKAQIMAHRIDWLVSGDDSEDTFHERLSEDMEMLLRGRYGLKRLS